MRARSLAWISLVIGCTVSLVRCAAPQPPLTRVVSDPAKRFSITLPADWEVLSNISGGPVSIVNARSAPNGPTIQVIASDPTAADLGAVTLATIRQLPGFVLVREGETVVAGRNAHYLNSTWGIGQPRYFDMHIILHAGVMAFSIGSDMVDDPRHLKEEVALVNRIINTLQSPP